MGGRHYVIVSPLQGQKPRKKAQHVKPLTWNGCEFGLHMRVALAGILSVFKISSSLQSGGSGPPFKGFHRQWGDLLFCITTMKRQYNSYGEEGDNPSPSIKPINGKNSDEEATLWK